MIDRIKRYLERKSLEVQVREINMSLAEKAKAQMLLLKSWPQMLVEGQENIYKASYAVNDADMRELAKKKKELETKISEIS